MNALRRVLKGSKHSMYEFNRKLLSGFATSVVVVAIMIVSLINTGSRSMSYSEREQQLLRKQNNPMGYQDNEIMEKIIIDKVTNYSYSDHNKEDEDKLKRYYIVVWNELNSIKYYEKVDHDYFKTVNLGDTWDGKTTLEDVYDDDYSSTDRDEWLN